MEDLESSDSLIKLSLGFYMEPERKHLEELSEKMHLEEPILPFQYLEVKELIRSEVLEKIEVVALNVGLSIIGGQGVSIVFPSKSPANIVFIYQLRRFGFRDTLMTTFV
ncbi:hypothetical protein P8452_76583 [Trifolium repens]|jgi:hypothetical protein|nr:hypothetical protein QL285_094466 [Trifolium repens]WJX95243.1 hypothetical protein P8452_76583 [Trifolium repens]